MFREKSDNIKLFFNLAFGYTCCVSFNTFEDRVANCSMGGEDLIEIVL